MKNKEKVIDILKCLKKLYPEHKCALNYTTPFELLAATILSAQTTDVQVNKVTQPLFKKYSSVKEYADADPDEFQKDVGSVNFYRNKASNIQGSARMIIEKYGSQVPKTMDKLISLPGVARKTANIVLSNVYGINEGIAVDTHVKRLSYRLGLTKNEDPVRVEEDLMPITPKEEWGNLSHLLILHGRKVCQARRPNHAECVLKDICPSREI